MACYLQISCRLGKQDVSPPEAEEARPQGQESGRFSSGWDSLVSLKVIVCNSKVFKGKGGKEGRAEMGSRKERN